MSTMATMRLLGGRPCLDLVNTVDARRDRWGPDLLASHADLLVWAERTQVLGASEIAEAHARAAGDPEAAEAVTRRVVRLREAIADVVSARLAGDAVPAAAAERLAGAVDAARRHQRLAQEDGQFGWAWVGEDPLDRVLHRVAIDAAALLTDPALSDRVKLCPGHACGWLFLDESRNGSRRWCRDAGCGAQARMRRFRAVRQEDGRSGS